jgi:hypothetical protein
LYCAHANKAVFRVCVYPTGTGGKAAGAWSWQFTQINTKVKNAWSYTSIPPYVFMAWYLIKFRNTFTLQR